MMTSALLAAGLALHRFWPTLPTPDTLIEIARPPSPAEAFTLQSLSGLATRHAAEGGPRDSVWFPTEHPAYQRLLATARQQTHSVMLEDTWAVAQRLVASGAVRGYILYQPDESPRNLHDAGSYDGSVNAATVAASQLRGLLVEPSLESKARAMGLPLLLDARNMTEVQAFERWGSACSRELVALIEPKASTIRAEAIAWNAFVTADRGPLYIKALARLEPGSPVLGWGIGDEHGFTAPASRQAAFMTATNWCLNLTTLAALPGLGLTAPQHDPAEPPIDPTDKHLVCFIVSDGDNVQWHMGDFAEAAGKSWWNSPVRGQTPTGWTFPYADLRQLSPATLDHLYRTATPNDELVFMSGGYYYPDLFGVDRPGPSAIERHAERIAGYARAGQVRSMLFLADDWDSPRAMSAYSAFARRIPDLAGIFAIQYYPYNGGQGEVRWVGRTPVISARFALWAGTTIPGHDSPKQVAAWINALPHAGPLHEDRVTFVTVHAWSDFGAEGVGASAVLETTRHLADHVRVVTPAQLARVVRSIPREMTD